MEQAQIKENKVLFWAAFSVAEMYLLASCFRDVLPSFGIKIRYIEWVAAIVAIAALIYVLITAKKSALARKELFARAQRALTYEQMFLAFLFFWYIFTCLLRQHITGGHQLKANATWIFVTGLTSFLFFPFAQYCGREKTRQRIEQLLKPVLLLYAVFVAWLLWQYFHANYIVLPSGMTLRMESPSMLQFGEMNHNVLARYGLTMMGISIYMVVTQKPVAKIMYGICVILFSTFMILTNSRTNWYVSFLMLVLAVFFSAWNGLNQKNIAMRIGFSILSACFVGFFYHWFREEIFALLDTALYPARVAAEAASAEASSAVWAFGLKTLSHTANDTALQVNLTAHGKELAAVVTCAAEDIIRTYDPGDASFGNRMPLYRACLQLMRSRRLVFLFGVTPSDVVKSLKMYEGVSQTYQYAHAHNFFLQMGVSFGVPTMLATVVFAVSLLIRSIRIMFVNRRKVFHGVWMIPILTICILAGDMLEAELNSSTEIICAVFYLFAGWLVTLDETTREKKRKRPEKG